ncbi:MAG: hypothetical protein AAGD28_12485 [Bacteroidota bacterium]
MKANLSNLFLLLLFLSLASSCEEEVVDRSSKPNLKYEGLSGYIGYNVRDTPKRSGVGVSFYTAAWKLIDQPIRNFQIGLPGTWIIPDNRDLSSLALCPPGTRANEWSERGPTYRDVFQTLEGGLGYWARNRYRYGPPKFSMNATAQCYDFEIASPGWSFFYDSEALRDSLLGIAQLHNRLLIPPDGLTFEGNPDGEFMGYSYMALPFTDSYTDEVATGNQSWTCFINTNNFKGPIAYYLPETWSKLSKRYPLINQKGLDSKAGIANGGAMEINTVQQYKARDINGQVYTKIPELYFPANEEGRAVLVQDYNFYDKEALFNDILEMREHGNVPEGRFKQSGTFPASLLGTFSSIEQSKQEIEGLNSILSAFTSNNQFGIRWKSTEFKKGYFPQYFKEEGEKMIPVKEEDVPEETGLREATFPTEGSSDRYYADVQGSWANPGPAAGPFTASLNDGSSVTYYWYKFIDQPVFQQYNWTEEKKNELQALIEKIHTHWTLDKDYIPPPSQGELISLDENLIIQPPTGMEVGYVPIVVVQRR